MTKEAFIKHEAADYMKANSLTQTEREELIAWIRGGDSVYDNAWCMTDESGRPMDYIAAVREVNDYRLEHGL